MIAVDTNVLVRVLVEDDREQTRVANDLVNRALAADDALFVPTVVLCELVWVLLRTYRYDRETVAEAVGWVLAAEQIRVEESEEAHRALGEFAAGRADFADALIRERARAHGAQAVATFDRSLHTLPGFVSPDATNWGDGLSLREAPPPYRLRRTLLTARS